MLSKLDNSDVKLFDSDENIDDNVVNQTYTPNASENSATYPTVDIKSE